jgi:hypothetical protein
MLLMDAFRVFDSDRNGLLGCSELYGGLEWLGLHLTPSQVHDIVRRFDKAGTGFITFGEFREALADHHCADGEDPLLGQGGGGAGGPSDGRQSFEGVVAAPKSIAELHEADAAEAGGGGAGQGPGSIGAKVLSQIRFALARPDAVDGVWSSKGTRARERGSVWAPVHKKSFFARMARPREQVCLGHYANVGFGKPLQAECPRLTLDITDTGKLGMSGSKRHRAVIDALLPKPRLWRLRWSKPQGKRPIYVWEAVPPDAEHVALGMFCTTTSDRPPLSAIRCVPRSWVTPAARQPIAIWDDSGTVGRHGSLWTVNRLGLLAATDGHEPPEGPFYDLQCDAFTSTEQGTILPA